MADHRSAKTTRRQLDRLAREREQLEKLLRGQQHMVPASLIARHLGTRQRKRSSVAFYLSWKVEGQTRLRHVSKKRLPDVRRRVAAWREFHQCLRRWRQIAQEMTALWKQLAERQAEDPGEIGV